MKVFRKLTLHLLEEHPTFSLILQEVLYFIINAFLKFYLFLRLNAHFFLFVM
jgi:hypothetical protein